MNNKLRRELGVQPDMLHNIGSVDHLTKKAIHYYNLGEFPRALKELDPIDDIPGKDLNINHATAFFVKGRILQELRRHSEARHPEARHYLKVAVDLDEHNIRFRLRLLEAIHIDWRKSMEPMLKRDTSYGKLDVSFYEKISKHKKAYEQVSSKLPEEGLESETKIEDVRSVLVDAEYLKALYYYYEFKKLDYEIKGKHYNYNRPNNYNYDEKRKEHYNSARRHLDEAFRIIHFIEDYNIKSKGIFMKKDIMFTLLDLLVSSGREEEGRGYLESNKDSLYNLSHPRGQREYKIMLFFITSKILRKENRQLPVI